MTTALPKVTHEHHERLMRHVEAMPEVGALLLATSTAELRPRLDELTGFLNELLLPHLEAAERAIHPELERMLQNRHSMAPLRREHDEIRRLVAELTRLAAGLDEARPQVGQVVALRRTLYPLYALLEVHLAEEELYVPIVDHQLSEEAATVMTAALDHAGIPTA
jgi:hemerythrin-like domain-containing protein